MIVIEHDVAELLGETVTPYELHTISRELRDKLAYRVGVRIGEEFTEEQFEAFERLTQAGDEAGAKALLDRAVPHHQDLVAQEWKALFSWFELAVGGRADRAEG